MEAKGSGNTVEVSTYSATQAQASTPTAVGYKPNEFTVNKESTVAGQLDSVIKQDSPLLQQARRRAELKSDQAMNDRGLLNSSVAVGAATDTGYFDGRKVHLLLKRIEQRRINGLDVLKM